MSFGDQNIADMILDRYVWANTLFQDQTAPRAAVW